MSSVSRQRQALMFRARSYTAFMFTPQPPIADWLAQLDATLARSKDFFADCPVALDLSAVELNPDAIAQLIASLDERKIRVLGIEGLQPSEGQAKLPPILRNGRGAHSLERPNPGKANTDAATEVAAVSSPALPAPKPQPASLLIEAPVRSGQSVVFMEGDITVLGSVGSGAEIVAGGSIHVYGALRGRAIAGAGGNPRARIFCHRVEADLLAIDCYYKTVDEIDGSLRRGPAQVWLDRGTVKISAMN